ncbi:hypothetical protein HII36_52435, partial [Nonomuraea sp. NN258]|uniref:YncE family protein n=1 Tax=Nonomuraea antri TaxID=2730852 RepID=UPI001C2B87D5
TRPDRYRVRRYDVAAGRLAPLFTRDKKQIPENEEEDMRGAGRAAVRHPGAGVLYTLYTHQDDHLHTRDLAAGRDLSPGTHAFVHVLHLDAVWAFCLDLPAPFGLGPARAHTLALVGERLFVFDASTGRLAQASTEELTIGRSAMLGPMDGEAFAAGGDGRLYLAAGRQVVVADAETLAVLARWELPASARGLALASAGPTSPAPLGELLAGAGEQVLRLDAASGAVLGVIALPGLRVLRHAELRPG